MLAFLSSVRLDNKSRPRKSKYAMTLISLAVILGMAAMDRSPLAVIEVGQAGGLSQQSVSIAQGRYAIPRTRTEWRGLVWYASRTSAQGTVEINSETCPGLRRVAEAFKDLPPITPTPPAAMVRDDGYALPLVITHRLIASVSFRTTADVDVRVRGSNAYVAWAQMVMNELTPCWPSPSEG